MHFSNIVKKFIDTLASFQNKYSNINVFIILREVCKKIINIFFKERKTKSLI